MMNQLSQKQNSRIRTAFLLSVFVVVFFLTDFTPLIADDFNYAFSWSYESRVDNFALLIGSMRGHRQWTHGRVFAQGWVTLFMMGPKWAFSIFNAFVVTLFFYAAECWFRFRSISRPVLASAVLGALLWICMPAFGQIFLWLDGACNYFWGAALGWLLVELTLTAEARKEHWVLTILLLPLAFAVGAWSEHISFAVLFILFLFLLRTAIEESRIPIRGIAVLLTGGLGYLYLMLAPSMLPSILKRRAKEAADGHVNGIAEVITAHWWIVPAILAAILLLALWLHTKSGRREKAVALTRLAFWIALAADVVFAILAIRENGLDGLISSTQVGFLSLMSVFFFGLKEALVQKVERNLILDALILCLGGLSALVLFAFAMYIPARGFCAPVAFTGIAAAQLWSSIRVKRPKVLLSALFVCTAICFAVGFSDILSLHRQALKREAAIKEALKTDGVLIAEPYVVRTKYAALYGLQDLAPGESWPNDIIKEYYELKEIVVVEKEEEGAA